jgi:hypothetical protein
MVYMSLQIPPIVIMLLLLKHLRERLLDEPLLILFSTFTPVALECCHGRQ